MREGRAEQAGSPRALYENPASEFIADFMGEANIVEAEVISVDGDRALIVVGGAELVVPARDAVPGPVRLSVRSNAITVAAGGGPLAGRVLSSAYLGDHVEYEIESPAGRLFAVDTQDGDPLPSGAAVKVGFNPRGLALIPQQGRR